MPDPQIPANADQSPAPHGLLDGAVFFGAEADDGDKTPDPDAPVVSPDVAKMQGQVDELSKQLAALRETNMTLMMQPAKPTLPAFPVVPKVEELPDVMEDPEGYAKALERQITARIEARMTAANVKATAENQATSQYNELWTDFKNTHKEYAEDSRRVQYAANQVAESLKRQGMDVEKYMFTYRAKFMEDVTREMDSIFGKPGAQLLPEPDADASRTGGMFGGGDSVPKPDVAIEPDNAFADIREWQEKTGFHR